jgi:putative heme iron utilization protein
VSQADYSSAGADPLAAAEATMVEHMNDDHPDAVLAYARAFGCIMSATRALITTIDRYGFELLAITPDGEQRVRVGFHGDIMSTEDARRAFIALARNARAQLSPPPQPRVVADTSPISSRDTN